MLPVVSIIGKSNLGKTILMEGLIWGLKSRGYRVATVRYTSQGMIFDVPDKDNWRTFRLETESRSSVHRIELC